MISNETICMMAATLMTGHGRDVPEAVALARRIAAEVQAIDPTKPLGLLFYAKDPFDTCTVHEFTPAFEAPAACARCSFPEHHAIHGWTGAV